MCGCVFVTKATLKASNDRAILSAAVKRKKNLDDMEAMATAL